jgi:PTH1 family peptidyl-tRNA hydrolase
MPTLLVGLGNPGTEFHNTRHNAGFRFIDRFVSSLGDLTWKEQFGGLVTAINDEKFGKLLILKPLTMMNSSGTAVAKVMNVFKITPNDLIVVHDDLEVPVGVIKIKQKGSHGGHNGLRSIHQAISCNEYRRLRIGIGRPPMPDMVRNYVLSKFSPQESELVDRAIDEKISNLQLIIPAAQFGTAF